VILDRYNALPSFGMHTKWYKELGLNFGNSPDPNNKVVDDPNEGYLPAEPPRGPENAEKFLVSGVFLDMSDHSVAKLLTAISNITVQHLERKRKKDNWYFIVSVAFEQAGAFYHGLQNTLCGEYGCVRASNGEAQFNLDGHVNSLDGKQPQSDSGNSLPRHKVNVRRFEPKNGSAARNGNTPAFNAAPATRQENVPMPYSSFGR